MKRFNFYNQIKKILKLKYILIAVASAIFLYFSIPPVFNFLVDLYTNYSSYLSIDKLKEYISYLSYENIKKFLDSITFLQNVAFMNIMLCITILLGVIQIFSALIGNEIINFFKIEEKFPKLSTYLKIRSKLQKYYLVWQSILITGVCLLGLAVNIFVFYVDYVTKI
jgi:hypothetical protein